MRYPISTGHAARLLQTTEPRLGEAVRQGKVNPAPPIVAGRRLWSAEHILAAAAALDALTEELENELNGRQEAVR